MRTSKLYHIARVLGLSLVLSFSSFAGLQTFQSIQVEEEIELVELTQDANISIFKIETKEDHIDFQHISTQAFGNHSTTLYSTGFLDYCLLQIRIFQNIRSCLNKGIFFGFYIPVQLAIGD